MLIHFWFCYLLCVLKFKKIIKKKIRKLENYLLNYKIQKTSINNPNQIKSSISSPLISSSKHRNLINIFLAYSKEKEHCFADCGYLKDDNHHHHCKKNNKEKYLTRITSYHHHLINSFFLFSSCLT